MNYVTVLESTVLANSVDGIKKTEVKKTKVQWIYATPIDSSLVQNNLEAICNTNYWWSQA